VGLSERLADFGGTARQGTLRDGVRPTGTEIFNAKSPAEQDAMLGPKAAEAVRAGEIGLDELVERSPLATQDDYITQKPLPQEGE
jgi:hypothetical protein